MRNENFHYIPLPYRFVADYSNGQWDSGHISDSPEITLNEAACVFQYAQTCFEGLKAYRTTDGTIVCFRPDMNAERFVESCKRILIPPVTTEFFMRAIHETVRANREALAETKSGGALYLRPYIIGTSPMIEVSPAAEYHFRVFSCPVGTYFGKTARPLSLTVSDYDRAAPRGTGHIKAGLNYAMSFYPLSIAHEAGYDENVYTDSVTNTYIEETGGGNLIFVTADKTLVVPDSRTILSSITRQSIITIAKTILNLRVEERPVRLDEIESFTECGLCGTAAVIAPVGSIYNHGKRIEFDTACSGFGKTCARLRNTLVSIQQGDIPAPDGWLYAIQE